MDNIRWQKTDLAYCSNAHAGENLDEICHNLLNFISPVRQQRGVDTMATGLWLSAIAAEQLQNPDELFYFQQSLSIAGLELTSINGFPYGDFHQAKVKQAVYLPDWSDVDRLQYTKNLSEVLAACLPEQQACGVISTLPLGYKENWHQDKQHRAEKYLAELADFLHQLKLRTGKTILVCLEMEPDCVLESTDELVNFFNDKVKKLTVHHQHISVCFDVCHQAVMHEDCYQSLQRIMDNDISIGKIQLSNALQVDMTPDNHQAVLQLLEPFCEPKYLHQVKTMSDKGRLAASPDLPIALAELSESMAIETASSSWRIHFHVPLHCHSLFDPLLQTTTSALSRVFDFLRDNPNIKPALEVETYSWQVLPKALRPQDDKALISGIVSELNWVDNELLSRGLIRP